MQLSVVIPTYNERENIERAVTRVFEVFGENGIDGEVVVVDDSSPDGTGEVVQRLKEDYDDLLLFVKEDKVGIGAAYKHGFPRTAGRFIMEMDADLSHRPEEIPRFLAKADEGFDLVVGSRYVEGGVRDDSFHRRIFPIVGNWMYRVLVGLPTTDTTSGYRLLRRSALERVDLEKLPDDFSFQSAMVFHFVQSGLRVGEVPITFDERAGGEPKYSTRDLLGNMKLLLNLFFRRLTGQ